MDQLDPAYLSTLATQVGGLSAFLGGFAATFLGTLLAIGVRGRTASIAIGCAVTSSVVFVIAVVASTALVAMLHPNAPVPARAVATASARVFLVLGFTVGLYTLLISLTLSGWSRSRGTGMTTSIVGGLGILLVTLLILSLGT